ncbi:MAG: metal-dependent hydrolase [Nanoarchaeota archaeon]|nr:metal-dependent hydrolase [Nanoarchaeota archaeon]
MVATSMHYIFGVMIAYLLGYRGNKKFWVGLLAVIPDIDAIFFIFLAAGRNIFNYSLGFYETSQTAVMLLGHRGISHSLFLFGLAVLMAYLFTRKRSVALAVFSIWGSHLVLDAMTSWKMFLLLPFSYMPFYLGIVEVFDSWLMFFTSLMLGFLICSSLIENESKKGPVFGYLFFLVLGVYPAIRMNEFNIQTIVLSQLVIFGSIIYCVAALKNRRKKRLVNFVGRGIKYSSLLAVSYLVLLIIGKLFYSFSYSIPFIDLEPLEEFAYNGNLHTYELDEGAAYRVGMVNLKGQMQEQVIPKVINDIGVESSLIIAYQEAYGYALHTNWINHPVWTFMSEDGEVYVNIRYAKSFLPTKFNPGPSRGVNVQLQDGLLVRYDRVV